MKSLLLMLCASTLLLAQAANAEPKGKGPGYWTKRPGVLKPGPSAVINPTVPEPSAMLVFGAGLLAVGIANRRRRSS
jgi:hypothetical protein